MPTPSGPGSRGPKLALECLEDRTTPVFMSRTGFTTLSTQSGVLLTGENVGLSIAVGDLIPEANFQQSRSEYVTGTGPGREGLVRLWDNNGTLISQFVPFPGFQGGLNVAIGDVVGDASREIIVGIARNGAPHIKVFSAFGQELTSFFAFTDAAGNPNYQGGVNIAVGNVLNEDLTTAPDRGVGSGGFFGGNNSNFKQEIIVGSAGGGIMGHVKVFDGFGKEYRSFHPFEGNFLGGVSVAASSIDSTRTPGSSGGGGGFGGGNQNRPRDTNSYAEIIIGATDGAPHVKAFSVWRPTLPEERLSYFAFDPSLGRGVTVAAGSTDGNRGAEIYAALLGSSTVRGFAGESGALLVEFQAFPPEYSRAVNMAVGNVASVFDAGDDDDPRFGNNGNSFFNTQDLVAVAGDGLYEQVPRVFLGRANSPAGRNGP